MTSRKISQTFFFSSFKGFLRHDELLYLFTALVPEDEIEFLAD